MRELPRRVAGAVLLIAAVFSASTLAASTWSARVDDRNGLPVISRGGANAVSATFAFWGRDWAWAEQTAQTRIVAPFDYTIAGKNQTLKLDLAARVTRKNERQLVWQFDWNAAAATADVVGGGIIFNLDVQNFGRNLGTPELLPGNRGWTWGRGDGRIELVFDPPLASIYFERGQPSEIRAFFYNKEIPAGPRRHVATLSVSGDIAIAPTSAERFGLEDPARWPAGILDWKTAPVDLSFLNDEEKPAGKHGFLTARQDKLIFEDGAVARFWGTNLTAGALFGTSRDNVRREARRLSQLGFNLVRLHHHDSAWVSPNIFGEQNAAASGIPNPAMQAKLDWWIKCLKDEGIYVWLDLHVGRQLTANDRIDAFAEISKDRLSADLKGYNYVNASIQLAMKRFNEAYLDHINAYTGVPYKAEPAIAALLLTNENDVTHHFGNSLLPDKNVPQHNARYMRSADDFARAHDLPKDKTWRSWEGGPAQIFLNDLEQRFNAVMIAHLRAQGVRTLVATTNTWGYNPMSSLPALTVGGIIDVHSYGGTGELEKNPLYAANLTDWIAAAHVAGKPLSVTEWNTEPFPVPDRHTVPLFIAATARLQGWDALMQYAYSQVPLNGPGEPSNWHAFNDPALIATLPAAALLYRRGDVREAATEIVFAPTKDALVSQLISAANVVAVRTALGKSKVTVALPVIKELPWLERTLAPAAARIVSDAKQSFVEPTAAEVVADTGELRRNWERGIYTIDTARTQAATGWIGAEKIELGDVAIDAVTRNASVAVQSLDNNPIASASRILISLAARSVPKAPNALPFFSEPVTGRLSIRARPGLKLYRSAPAADRVAIPTVYENGRYRIDLVAGLKTSWLVLK